MATGTRGQLEQAYRLIEKADLDGALKLLRPIVSAQPDNVDAWWLMANAASEPTDAYEALSNVVRLNPQHQEAKEQLDNLIEQFPEVQTGAGATPDMGDSMDSFSVDELLATSASKAKGTAPPEDFGAVFNDSSGEDDSSLDLG